MRPSIQVEVELSSGATVTICEDRVHYYKNEDDYCADIADIIEIDGGALTAVMAIIEEEVERVLEILGKGEEE